MSTDDINNDYKEQEQEEILQQSNVDGLISNYTKVLDQQQNHVYNIRIMHHDVWRDVHRLPGIVEARAGSRVEQITRILSLGELADVDYKLCVDDIAADVSEHSSADLRLQLSQQSKAYGQIIASKTFLKTINTNPVWTEIFQDAFERLTDSEFWTLCPRIFKENVVKYCNFEMQRPKDIQSLHTSPAVSGNGALNPYDLVPCLQLKRWPNILRPEIIKMYALEENGDSNWENWKTDEAQNIQNKTHMFVVPTGNPQSANNSYEWRLSFAMLEIEIFNQLTSHQRQLYGLAKFAFKVIFKQYDILSSYHLKVIFLRRLEEDDLGKWTPVPFVMDILENVVTAMRRQYVPHYFIANCNIFPFHKCDGDKCKGYEVVLQGLKQKFVTTIMSLIYYDVGVGNADDRNMNMQQSQDRLSRTTTELLQRLENGVSSEWVAGYLTRLYSVIVYSLQKSDVDKSINSAVENLEKLLMKYQNDENIMYLLPFIQEVLRKEYGRELKCQTFTAGSHPEMHQIIEKAQKSFSLRVHKICCNYMRGEPVDLSEIVALLENGSCSNDKFLIGVTVTKFHFDLFRLDKPLAYAMDSFSDTTHSNRFYIHPEVLVLHMYLQVLFSEKSNGVEINLLQNQVDRLCHVVDTMTHKSPYFGKLSYKHAGYFILKGYKKYLSEITRSGMHSLLVTIPFDEGDIKPRADASNFDLR